MLAFMGLYQLTFSDASRKKTLKVESFSNDFVFFLPTRKGNKKESTAGFAHYRSVPQADRVRMIHLLAMVNGVTV
ncbi:hypothetical protein N7462_006096 [Penicillium macrosclerotiorum]|uniref:uncharacterized protein n=1 Tax=Penicillium macrosclerotiorum TaxID=303699 RepID=UPI002548E087|nr:uncharacterized protein N7462_006096 [Penicillium macrosclerotiorum]KAJ5682931.1 hypothetical protein N7462_006096 [Penicillium macrosclerotiorum]